MEIAKKVRLRDVKTSYYYTDGAGFKKFDFNISCTGTVSCKDPYYYGRTIEQDKTINITDLYIERKDEKTGSKFSLLTISDAPNIFKFEKIYIHKKHRDPYNSYYNNKVVDLDMLELFKFKSVSIDCVKHTKSNYEAFWDQEVYEVPEDFNRNDRIYDYEIKEGMIVHTGTGKSDGSYKIDKVYPQPNKAYKLCTITSVYGDKTEVIYCRNMQQEIRKMLGSSPLSFNLYKVPYEVYPKRINELDIFDGELFEIKLSPFCENEGISGNLYWQPIEDAARYKVSLYKYREEEKIEKKLYLLEEFNVDRNKHWLTIDNLYGTNYIARITAEDRSGMPIAFSRGIAIKFAGKESKVQYWKK